MYVRQIYYILRKRLSEHIKSERTPEVVVTAVKRMKLMYGINSYIHWTVSLQNRLFSKVSVSGKWVGSIQDGASIWFPKNKEANGWMFWHFR